VFKPDSVFVLTLQHLLEVFVGIVKHRVLLQLGDHFFLILFEHVVQSLATLLVEEYLEGLHLCFVEPPSGCTFVLAHKRI